MWHNRDRKSSLFTSPPKRRLQQLTLMELEKRCLPSAYFAHGVWTINGDTNRVDFSDTIIIEHHPDNPSILCAIVNGAVIDTRGEASVNLIRVFAGRGDDTVTISLSGSKAIKTVLCGGSGDDVLIGGPFNDTIFGGPGNDMLDGRGGNDVIYGQAGDDLLRGSQGHDRLFGGAGYDTLIGGDGNNRLDGGLGKNLVYTVPTLDTVVKRKGDVLVNCHTAAHLHDILSFDELKPALIDAAVAQWKEVFGKSYAFWRLIGDDPVIYHDLQISATAHVLGTTSLRDFSAPNNQEIGVDEGDMFKTDGEYLYLLTGNELVILDAWPAEQMHIVSRVQIEGNPIDLYLYGDRVMVVSSILNYVSEPIVEPILRPLSDPQGDMNQISVGIISATTMAMPRYEWTPQLQVSIFDVSDCSAPQLIQVTTMDGYVVSSRAIDNRIYLVIENNLWMPEPEGFYDDITGLYTYETEESYRARLDALLTADKLPQFTTTISGQEFISGPIAAFSRTYIPKNPVGQDILSVVMFDITAGPEAQPVSTSIFGSGGTVYASTANLYVVSPNIQDADGLSMCNIYKFGLFQEGAQFVASGTVPGWVADQFSMDEERGFFRIATTSPSADTLSNNVFVLAQECDQLSIIGSVMGLGEGEWIRSVRFMGNRGFVTTFRTVDPLFALDMSNPYQPKLMGHLEIPGFSTYLHPVGKDYLIGLGRNADPNTGLPLELQLSLFDVSNLANPTRIAHYSFSQDTGSFSIAEHDHRAFSYFPEHKVLALPIDTWWWDDSGGSGLQVFKVTPQHGFELLGTIGHQNASILRSLRIQNVLYSVSEYYVKANTLENPANELASIQIRQTNDSPQPEPIHGIFRVL